MKMTRNFPTETDARAFAASVMRGEGCQQPLTQSTPTQFDPDTIAAVRNKYKSSMDFSTIEQQYHSWLADRKSQYRERHPAPMGAWDGGNWYRQCQLWERRFITTHRHDIDEWWRMHGYATIWTETSSGWNVAIQPI